MVNSSIKFIVNELTMVIVSSLSKVSAWYTKWRTRIMVFIIIIGALFAILKPQSFADLWLTRDQQGMLLFNMGYYQQASNHFSLVRWQAFSLYGAEEFDQSAILYDQFEDEIDQIARANALAHARRYVAAKNTYQQVLQTAPNNEQAKHNLALVQGIIDEVNRIAESQQGEAGDSPQELGDDPQTGDGAKKKEMVLKVAEHYDASQLLLDPKLNEMWLRQVQKDPARFLANKFQMQTTPTSLNSRPLTTNEESQ
ncbi:hypothetical protein [Shewanella sp. 10N.286.52.A9]|uniref:hypothetical protein n=1 Tax=Shewanella sp. 10N.286.52.A9 TaxID=3229711 RepID=UPI00354E6025